MNETIFKKPCNENAQQQAKRENHSDFHEKLDKLDDKECQKILDDTINSLLKSGFL